MARTRSLSDPTGGCDSLLQDHQDDLIEGHPATSRVPSWTSSAGGTVGLDSRNWGELSHIVLKVTTFDSVELSTLAEHIPIAAADKGLLFVADATFNREADVGLSAASVTLDMALAIAAAARAPFVSLSETRFDGELLRALMLQEEGGELPRKVDRIITGASTHEGELEELTLRWPAHGIIFEWPLTQIGTITYG